MRYHKIFIVLFSLSATIEIKVIVFIQSLIWHTAFRIEKHIYNHNNLYNYMTNI